MTDEEQEAFVGKLVNDAYRMGSLAERALIVGWLRRYAAYSVHEGVNQRVAESLATLIELGEHLI